jgi:magnesium-transporting ATPase (P-type)
MSSDKNKRRILTSKQSETRKFEEKPPDELIKKYQSLQLIEKFIQQHKMNLLIGKQMLAGSVGREMRGMLSHTRA